MKKLLTTFLFLGILVLQSCTVNIDPASIDTAREKIRAYNTALDNLAEQRKAVVQLIDETKEGGASDQLLEYNARLTEMEEKRKKIVAIINVLKATLGEENAGE